MHKQAYSYTSAQTKELRATIRDLQTLTQSTVEMHGTFQNTVTSSEMDCLEASPWPHLFSWILWAFTCHVELPEYCCKREANIIVVEDKCHVEDKCVVDIEKLS